MMKEIWYSPITWSANSYPLFTLQGISQFVCLQTLVIVSEQQSWNSYYVHTCCLASVHKVSFSVLKDRGMTLLCLKSKVIQMMHSFLALIKVRILRYKVETRTDTWWTFVLASHHFMPAAVKDSTTAGSCHCKLLLPMSDITKPKWSGPRGPKFPCRSANIANFINSTTYHQSWSPIENGMAIVAQGQYYSLEWCTTLTSSTSQSHSWASTEGNLFHTPFIAICSSYHNISSKTSTKMC